MARRPSLVLPAIVGLTLLAAVLRAIALDSELWFDEIVTVVLFVRRPLAELVTTFESNNNHPLYSLVGNLSVSALGESPWTVRLPAFLFGVACVPALYALATRLTSRRESLLASLLLAVSYHHVWFSQNARGYTALTFFTLAATWCLLRAWDEDRYRWWIAYALMGALGAYTHLTMVFVVVAHAAITAWVIATRPSTARTWSPAILGFALSAMLTLAFYGPMLPDVYAFFSGPPQKTAEVATARWAFLEMLRGMRIGMGAIGAAAAGLLLAAGLVSYWRRRPIEAVLFVAPGLVTAAIMVAMRAPIRPRFFVFLIGFGVLLLVRGATVITRVVTSRLAPGRVPLVPALSTAAVLLIAAASAASLPYNYRYPKQAFLGPLDLVESRVDPADTVATAGLATYPYQHYYVRPWRPVQTGADLDAAISDRGRTWVIYSFPEYIDRRVMATLTERCRPVERFHGTLGGGDVLVCVITPVQRAADDASTVRPESRLQ